MAEEGSANICAKCEEPIAGERITALGKSWHRGHFTCSACQAELVGSMFFEHDGAPYCQTDYHLLFSPKCASCNEPITGKTISAMGKTFHPEHFACKVCKKTFPDGRFRKKDGEPYCVEDFNELFGIKCAKCHIVIEGQYVTAMTKQWHSNCFACTECKVPFNGTGFFERDNRPYCKDHVEETNTVEPDYDTTADLAYDSFKPRPSSSTEPAYTDVVFTPKDSSAAENESGNVYDDPKEIMGVKPGGHAYATFKSRPPADLPKAGKNEAVYEKAESFF